MNTLQLRELRAKKWEGAKAFLDSARAENGILSAEDDEAYARMEKEIVDLGKEIERQERLEALDAQLAKPISTPIVEAPTTVVATAKVKTGRASDEYRENFWNMMRSKAPDAGIVNALQIVLGIFLVKVRFDLAAYRSKAPRELVIACIAGTVLCLANYWVEDIAGDDYNRTLLTTAFVLVCWAIALYRYFKTYQELFVN